jgi:LCP family protein required for cell wall assembly
VNSNNGTVTGKRPKTPGRVFAKFFAITFVIAIIVCTGGVAVGMQLLSIKPMEPMDDGRPDDVAVEQTEQNLELYIPGEGMFATDYKDSKRVNVLLLGNTDEELTDTIMLASFDTEAKKVDIISVPRDTYYEREGMYGAFLKINSVFHEGVYATAQAVHNVLLGIPINYYAVIGYDGIKKIVDSMGGVEIDVPQRMYYVSAHQNLYIDLQPGLQVLDGDHAVQFIRYRKGYREGDLGRVNAQQNFVKAAIKTALGKDLVKVARTVMDNVQSNIAVGAMLYLAKEGIGMDMSKVDSVVLPGEAQMVHGGSFWIPATVPEVEAMLRGVYDPQAAGVSGSAVTGGATSGGATSGGAAAGGA